MIIHVLYITAIPTLYNMDLPYLRQLIYDLGSAGYALIVALRLWGRPGVSEYIKRNEARYL
jgi:uncharacterized MAPEG superfamily protein